MRPVRRRIRSHFGLTAKQVAVRSHRSWYFQGFLAFLLVVLGFALAYLLFRSSDYGAISQQLQATTLENKMLEFKLIEAQRELQIETATNNNLAKDLAKVQDENLRTKEDLLFYKTMLNKRVK